MERRPLFQIRYEYSFFGRISFCLTNFESPLVVIYNPFADTCSFFIEKFCIQFCQYTLVGISAQSFPLIDGDTGIRYRYDFEPWIMENNKNWRKRAPWSSNQWHRQPSLELIARTFWIASFLSLWWNITQFPENVPPVIKCAHTASSNEAQKSSWNLILSCYLGYISMLYTLIHSVHIGSILIQCQATNGADINIGRLVRAGQIDIAFKCLSYCFELDDIHRNRDFPFSSHLLSPASKPSDISCSTSAPIAP